MTSDVFYYSVWRTCCSVTGWPAPCMSLFALSVQYFWQTWSLTDYLSVFSFHVRLLYDCIWPPHQVRHLVLMYLPVSCFVFSQGLVVLTCFFVFSYNGFLPRCSELAHAEREIVALFVAALLLLFWFLDSSHMYVRVFSCMLGLLQVCVCVFEACGFGL